MKGFPTIPQAAVILPTRPVMQPAFSSRNAGKAFGLPTLAKPLQAKLAISPTSVGTRLHVVVPSHKLQAPVASNRISVAMQNEGSNRVSSGSQTIQRALATRAASAAANAANPSDVDTKNSVHGARQTKQPDRLGDSPATYKNRNGVTMFNPGSAAILTLYIKFSGDSMKDISEAVKRTSRGAPGSGEVWHHMSDYNPTTGCGTLILMDAATHAAIHHHGGSAMARAHIYDDPDKKAKYSMS